MLQNGGFRSRCFFYTLWFQKSQTVASNSRGRCHSIPNFNFIALKFISTPETVAVLLTNVATFLRCFISSVFTFQPCEEVGCLVTDRTVFYQPRSISLGLT